MKIKFIVKYFSYAIAFCFFQYSELKLGIYGISIAFFFALVYMKQNLLVLCPIFLAASLIGGLTWQNAVVAATPICVALVTMFLHYKLRKPLRLPFIIAYASVSNIPRAVFCSGDTHAILCTAISFALGACLTYAFITSLRATMNKGLRFKLSFEERTSFGIVFAVLGACFNAMSISWFNPFYSVLIAFVLLLYGFEGGVASAVALSFGLGAALFSGALSAFATSGCLAVAVALLKRERILVSTPVIAAVAVISMVIFQKDTFNWYSALPIAGVSVAGAILIYKFGGGLKRFEVCFGSKRAERGIINRGRRELSARLSNLSTVFFDMGDMLMAEHRERELAESVNEMVQGVNDMCCKDCLHRKNCAETLGVGRADAMIADLVAAAVDHGTATILDTPPFLNANCRRINRVITSANEVVAGYIKRNEEDRVVHESRETVGIQMKGVGRLLGDMSEELNKQLDFRKDLEVAIVEELSLVGIGSSDVVVYDGDRGKEVSLLVKEGDLKGNKLTKAVSRALDRQMEISAKECALGGTLAITLSESPLYAVMYGERYMSAGVGIVKDAPCGDRLSAARIAGGKVMLVLSDGMGSGMPAADSSSGCVALLESLYKAGFDMEAVVGFVGRLMSTRMKNDFNALDIGVLDTQNGTIDFIKLGGRESILASKEEVVVARCGSLPMGAIDEPMPIVQRYDLRDDTLIVMVSDGIIDVVGEGGLKEIAAGQVGANPESVADLVMDNFLHIVGDKEHDDASVLVARVIKVNS